MEDDEILRTEICRAMAGTADILCIASCASAEAALDQLPYRAPDVVLVDIQLPQLSGIECIRRLRPLLGGCQFMVLTVMDDYERIFESVLAGASGYLLKDKPCEEVLAAIRLLHGGGAPMSNSVARRVLEAFRRLPHSQPSSTTNLTQRETEILNLIARGKRPKEAALALNISNRTVESHLGRIYQKLHAHDMKDALDKYQRRLKFQREG